MLSVNLYVVFGDYAEVTRLFGLRAMFPTPKVLTCSRVLTSVESVAKRIAQCSRRALCLFFRWVHRKFFPPHSHSFFFSFL